VREEDLVHAWLEATSDLRGDELPLPERSLARDPDVG